MQISFHQPSPRDIEELLADMLPADRLEILGLGFDPGWVLPHSVEQSAEVVAVRGDGVLGSIVGIMDGGLSGDPQPWMVSTSRILCQPKEVLRVSRKIYLRWQSMYPYMWNYCDARHFRAIAWLKWLGAKFPAEPEPVGPFNRPYFKFEFGEPQCV